jgi:hypothetical protein
MAVEVGNLSGFVSGGTEEAVAVAGTPVVNTTDQRRTGGYSCQFNAGGDDVAFLVNADGSTDQGNNLIVGFAIRFADKIPSSETEIVQFDDNADATGGRVVLKTDGDIEFRDDAGTAVATFTPTVNQWHYVEVFWEEVDTTGDAEMFVDDVSIGSTTTGDFVISGTGLDRYLFSGAEGADFRITDFYSITGATAASDRRGKRTEVRGAWQNDVEDATDQGTALTVGTWGATAGIPFDTPGTVPGYEGGAESGHTLTDDADSNARPGPAGDGLTGTIEAVKYMYGNMYRGNGGGTTHSRIYGHEGDTTSAVVTLSNTPTYFEYVIQGDIAQAPTISEAGAIGIQKSAGGRDIYVESLAICVLHVPSAGITMPRQVHNYRMRRIANVS